MYYGFRETNEKRMYENLLKCLKGNYMYEYPKQCYKKQNEGDGILCKTRLGPDSSKQT